MKLTSISNHYDERGDNFLGKASNPFPDRYLNLVGKATLSFIENLIPEPGEQSSFLDLCCGTGIYSIYPASIGYRVIGVDLSPNSIRAARWLAEVNHVSMQSQFIQGDVSEFLKNSSDQFDVIFCSGSLYYLESQSIFLKIHERLKPNGLFLLLETNGSNFVMNAYRYLNNRFTKKRDDHTLRKLLRRKDFMYLANRLTESKVKYFDLFTLPITVFFRPNLIGRFTHSLSAKLDDLILNKFHLHFLGFKVILAGKKSS